MKYEVQIVDMKLGIGQLQEITGKGDPKVLAAIYAEGRTKEHAYAIIDLFSAAFDLLNERLVELRKEHDPKPDIEVSNLGWYYRELAKGNGDRITLTDHR